MYNYVYIIYAFVKFLDKPHVIICLSCHPKDAGLVRTWARKWLRAEIKSVL